MSELLTPVLEPVMDLSITVGTPLDVGDVGAGVRRFVPITGGTFAGPLLSGKVVPGSGDWQIVRSDGALNAEARYILETADGVLIAVNNRGVRHASPEVMAQLNQGELVPPASYYFRTSATFEAPVGSAHEWVNRTLFVATAEREPSTAVIHFFRVL